MKKLNTFFAITLLVGIEVFSSATFSNTTAEGFLQTQFEGNVVVLDFWASWCGPCRKSFPWLNQMQAKYADSGLTIIGVNVDANAQDAQDFLEKHPADFKVIYDAEGELAKHYQIVGMPSTVILSQDGDILEQHHGFKEKHIERYEKTLRRHLFATKATDGDAPIK